jgi:hypothetical protein
MAHRIDRLLNAYFTRPLKEYARTVLSVKKSGRLSPDEIDLIQSRAVFIHADTIIRHLQDTDDPEKKITGH